MSNLDASKSRHTILKADNIRRSIAKGDSRKDIISGFSFEFQKGAIYSVLGPSGAGKSSLLRLFNRLDETTDGRILFDGKDIKEFSPCWLRRKIGYLFQTPYLFPGTVKDNLLYVDPSLSNDMLIDSLSEVNLGSDYLGTDVEVLSVGEKQRIALARLFTLKPDILLLDEPTSALDEKNASQILRLIANKISRNGLTAITVMHNPGQALMIDGEGLLIMRGRLIEHGPVKKLIAQPATEEGKSFLGSDAL